jgi:succinoglycan biosynthesis protein ExoV
MKGLRLYGWADNFGDALNYWLWPRLFPGHTDGDDALLLGIGTVLSHNVPDLPGRKFVLGSGAGNDALPCVTNEWTFLSVRGPRTAEKLSLPQSLAVTDSALLIRSQLAPADERNRPISFMPHIISVDSDAWREIADDLELFFIDPRKPVDEVMAHIRDSELLITEAMHGAIVADAFRVPWIRVQSGELHAPTFKWLDWTDSLNIDHESHWLPFLWREDGARSIRGQARKVLARERLRWIRRFGRPKLSVAARSDEAFERLWSNVEVIQRWLADGSI